jgi:ATP adenylyltransferase
MAGLMEGYDLAEVRGCGTFLSGADSRRSLKCQETNCWVMPMQGQTRFSRAFSALSPNVEDLPLWRDEQLAVLPTLGMIVPNWFLIVPKVPTFNFAQQTADVRAQVPSVVSAIFRAVASPGDEMLVFEHGAQQSGSPVGCGLDHAHIHVLVAASALLDVIWPSIQLDLQVPSTGIDLGGVYDSVEPQKPYYLAWRSGLRLVQQPPREEISQRFRRIIAAAAGMPDRWDYREHPFYDNIASTVAAVQCRMLMAA